MQKTCANPWCASAFEITPDDLAFYERVSPVFAGKKELIPPPTLCPACRYQRRCAFRNERKLYHRTCDFTRKTIVSAYSPDKPLTVYANDTWWSDAWDGREYGQQIDFSHPVFDQIDSLLKSTPFINLLNVNSENSDYTLNATYNKNCYMLFCGSFNEDCMHCYWIQNSLSCVDCSSVRRSERCYECNECFGCYALLFSRNCVNCQTSFLLSNCMNCSQCVGCVGLRNASYCWLNQQLSKEDFEERLLTMLRSPKKRASVALAFEELHRASPQPWSHQRMTENCSGNYIYESQNCRNCFNTRQAQDCADCQFLVDMKEARDSTMSGLKSELFYECNNFVLNAYHCLFSGFGYGNKNVLYCHHAHYCTSCFGCVNLHHRQYCIFNKQYTKEEYENLVPKIIDHMRKTGEWGEYFPVTLSPFAYNETVAQEYFPLTKEEVLRRGWKWREEKDEMPKVAKVIPASKLPDSIGDVPDDIVNWAIDCEATRRPFRIIRQELDFYRKMQLPIPHFHPDERHSRRMALRNQRKLWKRPCMKCGKEMETTYAPDRPEIVYCEECYLKEVY
ncbi:hypothetical protein A3J91_01610 [Candidatus Peribacteria bacterium RIFOXYC2_FULL_58_10]|nr:MAG: hypothetical protein A3J91_01610 [Candidatus Peribacteria bacterium RIFOXYC2_FULL_58_10]OGJ84921.1 MAG: hypothetical protein A2529_00245 [Candidatus Peribacteria bacterium RIFOXYD2_FULL_58_15]HAS34812.1 hypothetical protein [Candidatus Peribacteria bacterium]